MALIPITDGAAIGNAIKACLEAEPCKTILCNCCCPLEDVCTNCTAESWQSYGVVIISGDVTVTDMGPYFNYQDTFHCDCFWVWNDGSHALNIFYKSDPKEWCADFYDGEVQYSAQNCVCASGPGIISELECTEGLLIGTFTLPKVGGGTGVTVTLRSEPV